MESLIVIILVLVLLALYGYLRYRFVTRGADSEQTLIQPGLDICAKQIAARAKSDPLYTPYN